MNQLVYLLVLLSLAGCAALNMYRLTADITGKVTIEGNPVAGVKVILMLIHIGLVDGMSMSSLLMRMAFLQYRIGQKLARLPCRTSLLLIKR